MALLSRLGLRRRMIWDKPTLLDEVLQSPLKALVVRLYHVLLRVRGHPEPAAHKAPVVVVCLSDTHDQIVDKVPDGDLLIHAGDLTNLGTAADIQSQIDWLASLPHPHKVLVCGNHDSWFDIKSRKERDMIENVEVDYKGITYLENASARLQFKGGRVLTVYGTAYVPKCGGPDFAFQYSGEGTSVWKNAVPLDTDILVTHGPPRHHLDLGLGDAGLLEEVWQVRPKLHVFGHVHCGRGVEPVYWDRCQRAYERVMARQDCGPLRDFIPRLDWIDALIVLLHGLLGIMLQWLGTLWLQRLVPRGSAPDGSIMVNAACMDGNTGELTKKPPYTIRL